MSNPNHKPEPGAWAIPEGGACVMLHDVDSVTWEPDGAARIEGKASRDLVLFLSGVEAGVPLFFGTGDTLGSLFLLARWEVEGATLRASLVPAQVLRP